MKRILSREKYFCPFCGKRLIQDVRLAKKGSEDVIGICRNHGDIRPEDYEPMIKGKK